MSDFSPGGYPPPPPPPGYGPAPSARRRNPAAWIAIAAAAVLVVTAGVGAYVLLNRNEPAVTPVAVRVALEPAADPGVDPFLAEVEVREVAAFPDAVLAVADTTTAAMANDPASGTLTIAGTAAALYGGRPDGTGLYGGSGDQAVCDIDQLATFLEANPDKAAAWAAVQGIAPGEIRDFLTGLTPVALLVDTAVTNYGFAGGVATPRQSVLQAGTAVLVDDTGLPVVRCACGNPLTAPQVTNLPGADFYGNRWAGFDPARTVSVTRGSAVTSFSLVDLETGASFERPVGVTLPVSAVPTAVLLGIAGPYDPAVGITSSSIVSSPDGATWSTVFTPSGIVHALAAGGGTVVAVGETTAISPDGIAWEEVSGGPTGVWDVGYGDGKWLAVGQQAEGSSAGPSDESFRFTTFTSTDGRSWQAQQVAVQVPNGDRMDVTSVAYGNGQWTVAGVTELGDSAVQVHVVSTDGQTWVDPGASDWGPVGEVAWNGQLWGQVGGQINYFTDPPTAILFASTSADLDTWSTVNANPTGSLLGQLTCSGDRGWLSVGSDLPLTTTDRPAELFNSADLVNWTRVGRPDIGGLVDAISYGDANAPSPQACGVAGAGAAAPGAVDPDGSAAPDGSTSPDLTGRCVLDVPGEAGWLLIPGGLPEIAAGYPCEYMQQIWAAYLAGAPRPDITTFDCVTDWYGQGTAPEGYRGVCPISPKIEFTGWRVGSPGAAQALGQAPAVTPDGGSSAPVAPAGAVDGDLGLSVPMTQPACDGTGIVLLFASVTPGAYAQEIQQALNEFPNSSYLRTDQACPSLTQATAAGDPIYAVYRVAGPNAASVCAGVAAAGGSAYGKWLDNSTPPEARVDC